MNLWLTVALTVAVSVGTALSVYFNGENLRDPRDIENTNAEIRRLHEGVNQCAGAAIKAPNGKVTGVPHHGPRKGEDSE